MFKCGCGGLGVPDLPHGHQLCYTRRLNPARTLAGGFAVASRPSLRFASAHLTRFRIAWRPSSFFLSSKSKTVRRGCHFLIDTLARFQNKRHTRFAYVVLLRASRRFREPAAVPGGIPRLLGSTAAARDAPPYHWAGNKPARTEIFNANYTTFSRFAARSSQSKS